MPKVLIFKETLLPPSETFIDAQMKALRRFEPRLIGLERSSASLPIDGRSLLLSRRASAFSELRARIYRKTGVAPLFHHRARAFRPDLVHAHFASGGRAAIALAENLRVPLLVTLHGSDVTVRHHGPDYYRRLGATAAGFVCVSQFIRDRALQAGFPAEKLFVHHIGIDRGKFAPISDANPSKGVLFVGRLVEKKGCEYLIRAMQIVQQQQPDSELTIIGDGPLRGELESLALMLQLRCRFLGVQPAESVRDALRHTRILCAPSVTAANGDSEGLPIAIVEAQAMGIPVVATVHAGIPEIVLHGVTGLLAPERDAEALACSMMTLLQNNAQWGQLRRAAVEHVRNDFDLMTQTARLESIYDEYLHSSAA